MISIEEILLIHNILIEEFGGSKGVRDAGSLDAAIKRPWATFDNADLYPSVAAKAAALIQSLLINHPFIDGNKRTGYVIMRLLLQQSGFDIKADENEKYDFVVSIASGQRRFEEIETWIEGKLYSI